MPEKVGVRVRCLPDGKFCDACEISVQGRSLELEVMPESFPPGALLEIERGELLFWGELQQLEGTRALVSIEHSLDTSRLQPVREIWGE